MPPPPYVSDYRHALVVLADTTRLPMPSAAWGAGQALIDYLGAGLIVVRDVFEELRRNQSERPGIRVVVEWLEAEEERRIHDLTPEHAVEVRDMLALYQLPGDHPAEHLGEIATVYGALELTAAGCRPLVCMDDQLGKSLCRRQGVAHRDTPALLVEMVCEEALDPRLGQRIWQALFPERRALWAEFGKRVEQNRSGRTA